MKKNIDKKCINKKCIDKKLIFEIKLKLSNYCCESVDGD